MNARNTTKLILALAVSAALPQIVNAQGVGNIGSLPNNINMHPSGTGWVIGTPPNPIPVVRDPNGPKWMKHLSNPNGGPISVAGPGAILDINETVQIAGNLSWSDWHEEILTPGWEWTNTVSILENVLNPPANLNIVNTPGNTVNGGTLEFYFDPLAPGTLLNIRKQLIWTGIPGIVGFTGHIDIAQYPTPEPASLALLGLGGLLVMRRSRRPVAAA